MAFWTRGAEAFDTNIDLADLSVSIRTKEKEVEEEMEREMGLHLDDPQAEAKFQLKIARLEEFKKRLRGNKELTPDQKKEKQKEVAVEMIATFRVAAKYKQYEIALLALKLSPAGWEFTCDPGDDIVPAIFKEIAKSARENREQLSERSPEFKLAEEILERSSRIPVAMQVSQLVNGGLNTVFYAYETVVVVSPKADVLKKVRKLSRQILTTPSVLYEITVNLGGECVNYLRRIATNEK